MEEREILDDINKGSSMGSEAIRTILPKACEKDFKSVLNDLLKEYEELEENISNIYDKYSDDMPQDTSTMEKVMSWYGIQIRTISDDSTSKLAEIVLQGLNMGIIDGKRIKNNNKMNKKISEIVDKFIGIQEKYVEKLKVFL